MIKPFIEHSTANEDILLYEGDMTFYTGFGMFPELKCTGKAVYEWLPFPRVMYYFQKYDVHGLIISEEQKIFHKPLAARTVIHTLHETALHSVEAYIDSYETGDRYKQFDFLQYRLANLFGFGFAKNEKRDITEEQDYFITFTINDYELSLQHFMHEAKTQSIIRGGFMLTGAVEIRKTGKKISLSEADELMEIFRKYLSFFNGHMITPAIVSGVVENQVTYQSFRSIHDAESFSPTMSWLPRYAHKKQLDASWKKFYAFYQTKNEKDCLELVIHWYLVSLYTKSGVEASLVLIQNALELLCSWILVEREFILDKNDNDISAASKINILLTWAGILNKIPDALKHLTGFANSNNILSGPEAITHIRNKMVHPDLKNRKRYREFTFPVKYEALQMALNYCELVLLRLLEYNDGYRSRINRNAISDKIGADPFVPWNKEEKVD
ncbi:MAG: hypothetical protein J0H85_13675 [Sediminibacterium magnilacihabitans]|nr:hypothetical protein [Sediminibacterium magnilacihabitans]